MNNVYFTYKYTSLTANSAQATPSNSIGGYISTNEIYSGTRSINRVSSVATTIGVDSLPSSSSGLASVGFEIVNYSGTSSSASQLTNITRGIVPNQGFVHGETPYKPYVKYLNINNLFDPIFDNNQTQYRCVAVQNSSHFDAYSVQVRLIEDNTANVITDIGIEVPYHDFRTGSITTATSSTVLVDSTLAGLFDDNHFANASFHITTGTTGRYSTISSFDGTTGTFVISPAISGIVVGDGYSISAAPSQRVANQLAAPVLGARFFGFLKEGGTSYIDYNNIRENSNTFRPNDVFYLWIKRTLPSNKKSARNTGAVVLFSYTYMGS